MNLDQTKHTYLSEELFIFQRMADGDHHALRFFFDKYYEDLCNFVNLYLHDKTASEDIVQDLFVYFWEKRAEIKIEFSVKAYLLSASRNRYLNYVRAEKSHQTISHEVVLSHERYTSPEDSKVDFQTVTRYVNGAIAKLPPRCREVYRLHKEEDLSIREIALKMDIAEKTVENQMTIAIKKLRQQLVPFYKEIFAMITLGLFSQF
jgi:RNA polymerase sigma-70 factor (ECF subfamily)